MSMSASQAAALLNNLPRTHTTPPDLPLNTVRLYKDNNWNSTVWEFKLTDYRAEARHIVPARLYDEATYISFNLPVGTVVTMTDDVADVTQGANFADLSDCGRIIDLVGIGAKQGIDLVAYGMNDCISMFFWRQVDLNIGAVELFEHVNFGGIRNVLFLSEWSQSQVHSIAKWWMQDKTSSVRWTTLQDRQMVSLHNNYDGTGGTYDGISGWGDIRQIASLVDVRFNDMVSSFSWRGLRPVKEIVAPFAIKATGGNLTSFSTQEKGVNSSTQVQPLTVSYTNTEANTITVTTTDTFTEGIKFTVSEKSSAKIGDIGEEFSWSVETSFQYAHTDQTTKSLTQTVALTVSHTLQMPPNTQCVAELVVQFGKIPLTTYTTTAERWYDQPISGGVPDGNLFKRTEKVSLQVSAGLAADTTISIKSTPL